MKYQIATGPATEPVTLSEAKTQLRVEHNEENDLIAHLISVCRRKVEQETGRLLLTQTVSVRWDDWPIHGVFELPLYPAQSVTAFNYIDPDGALTLWPSENYQTDFVGMCPRIMAKPDVDLPDLGDYANAIQVEYVGGETSTGNVPPELKHSILTTLSLLYERREDMPLSGEIRTASWLQFNSRQHLI